MPSRLRLACAALVLAGPAAAQVRPVNEDIGAWVLTCSTDTTRGLRFDRLQRIGLAAAWMVRL